MAVQLGSTHDERQVQALGIHRRLLGAGPVDPLAWEPVAAVHHPCACANGRGPQPAPPVCLGLLVNAARGVGVEVGRVSPNALGTEAKQHCQPLGWAHLRVQRELNVGDSEPGSLRSEAVGCNSG